MSPVLETQESLRRTSVPAVPRSPQRLRSPQWPLLRITGEYQNGVDLHFDWGASQFLTKQFQIGLVGYVYDEIGCDSGSGDRVGCFKSRVIGVGPQVGFIIPISATTQGYLNLKGYREFDNANRPDGWNAWVTFVLSPAQQTPSTSSTTRRMRSM